MNLLLVSWIIMFMGDSWSIIEVLMFLVCAVSVGGL